MRDLKEEFGFTIGPWNQAYQVCVCVCTCVCVCKTLFVFSLQFDTLPIALSGPENMKPGDLVFISGIYYSPKGVQFKLHAFLLLF